MDTSLAVERMEPYQPEDSISVFVNARAVPSPSASYATSSKQDADNVRLIAVGSEAEFGGSF
jgi:hypothetical protein